MLTVAITPEDADAAADGHQVALAEDADTTITIVVTSGEDTATYTVTVTAGYPEPQRRNPLARVLERDP